MSCDLPKCGSGSFHLGRFRSDVRRAPCRRGVEEQAVAVTWVAGALLNHVLDTLFRDLDVRITTPQYPLLRYLPRRCDTTGGRRAVGKLVRLTLGGQAGRLDRGEGPSLGAAGTSPQLLVRSLAKRARGSSCGP